MLREREVGPLSFFQVVVRMDLTVGISTLADLSIAEGKLTLHIRGADKLWSFKSTLEIPLVHITGVRADSEAAHGWYRGIRMPGTNVPRVITAGTFYRDDKRVFWDVHNPEKTIVIDLRDERYNELVVEANDPEAPVRSSRMHVKQETST